MFFTDNSKDPDGIIQFLGGKTSVSEATNVVRKYLTATILYRVDGGDIVENCGEVKDEYIWKFWFKFGFGPLCGHLKFMRTRSVSRPVAESRGGGTGEQVGRGGRGRGPRLGNDKRVNELNGQGNDQGLGANRNLELVDSLFNPVLSKGVCMRTRSQARRLRQQQLHQQQVPPNLVELPIVTMADNRTMAELLQAPTEGYEMTIVCA
ncbi:hypothetical protein Tco_1575178 [Tanacetum coccineum]